MSQLDALYGEKEARTFATNHGLQILYAPREQRDADEYSAMLGHFTERATSRSHSRSFGQHGHSSTGRNESDQRRALLLPQEFKELGSERLVVIFENCKPILGEKIRYHRDKVFKERLRRAPTVPRMNMDLHSGPKAQQRDALRRRRSAGKGQDLTLDDLAQDFSDLSRSPMQPAARPSGMRASRGTSGSNAGASANDATRWRGAIEPVATDTSVRTGVAGRTASVEPQCDRRHH